MKKAQENLGTLAYIGEAILQKKREGTHGLSVEPHSALDALLDGVSSHTVQDIIFLQCPSPVDATVYMMGFMRLAFSGNLSGDIHRRDACDIGEVSASLARERILFSWEDTAVGRGVVGVLVLVGGEGTSHLSCNQLFRYELTGAFAGEWTRAPLVA